MALIPTFEIRVNNDEWYLVDTTGLYDADVNEGGYGAPNTARADVTRFTVSIEFPDGTTTDYDTDDSTLTLAKLTGAGTSYFNVILAKKELEFVDGEYTVTYTVYEGATEYEYTDTWFYLEDVKCCVYKEMSSLVRTDKCKKIDAVKEVLGNWAVYKSIQFNAAGGTSTEATYLLEKLQKWCNNTC